MKFIRLIQMNPVHMISQSETPRVQLSLQLIIRREYSQ
jgi:hypothetical protein